MTAGLFLADAVRDREIECPLGLIAFQGVGGVPLDPFAIAFWVDVLQSTVTGATAPVEPLKGQP